MWFKQVFLVTVSSFFYIHTFSQTKIFSYEILNTTEYQDKITLGAHKFVNLLEVEAELLTDKWWQNGAFELAFWSVFQSKKESIVYNQLTFSNLEAINRSLLCSKLGYNHNFGDLSIFGGIRNASIDYFTSPITLLFTNSSSGVFPVVSFNFNVPNYPLSALGIHAEYQINKMNIKTSVYSPIKDLDDKRIFNFDLNNGIANISQLSYSYNNSIYVAGMVIQKLPHEKANASSFFLAEQFITKIGKHNNLSVLAQYGISPIHNSFCKHYWGLGASMSARKNKDHLGFILFRAQLENEYETCFELTYKLGLNKHFSLQPALHYVNNNKTNNFMALVRFIALFGN